MLHKMILGPILALVAATAGCIAPATGTVTIPLPGGELTLEFQGVDPTRTVDLTGTPGIQGGCVQIEFMDANGESLGKQTVRVPADLPVPPGATDFHVKSAECEELESGADGGEGPEKPGGKFRCVGPKWWFLGGPTDPDLSAGSIAYSMTIRAAELNVARAMRDAVLAGGLFAPLPPNVEIHHYSSTQLVGTDVVFTIADDDPFRSLTLDLNGQPYATLNEAFVGQQNGWHLAVLPVPQSEFNFDPGAAWSNEFEVRYTVRGKPRKVRAAGRFAYTQ